MLKSKSPSASSKGFQSGFRLFWREQEFVNGNVIFLPNLYCFSSLYKFWWPTFCDKEEDEKWIGLGESVLVWQTSRSKGQAHCHSNLSPLSQVEFERNPGIMWSPQSPVFSYHAQPSHLSVIYASLLLSLEFKSFRPLNVPVELHFFTLDLFKPHF